MKNKSLTYNYYGAKFVKRPKYRNKSCHCTSGHLHHSILEADYCSELSLLKKAGEIKDYQIQHKIEIIVKGQHITNHYVDFLVLKPSGHAEFHEVKGYATDVWKIKRRLVEANFPGIPYIVKEEKEKNLWKRKLKQNKS